VSYLLPSGVATVFTDAGGSMEVCVTVANYGQTSVRLTMSGGGSTSVDLGAAATGALCRNSVASVTLTCLDPSSTCTAEWRVDNQ
jgi:hypothetical protein